MSRNTRWSRAVIGGVAVLALSTGLVACGDDDESADDTEESSGSASAPAEDETTTTAAEGSEGEEGEEGGPPDENPCAPGAEAPPGDPEAEPPAEGATEVTITARDYEFEGYEELAATGDYAVSFANEGTELHELVVMKIKDDEERSLEELLQLPEEEAQAAIEAEVGGSFACPGQTADPVAFSVESPGRYIVVCFIPTGTLPTTTPEEFQNPQGPPHFVQGMAHEFTVA
jgi:hypothetical protein